MSHTASRHILIPDSRLINDMECPVEALWRDVDMARLAQRRRRNPEHLLLLDPWDEKGRDFGVELAHGGGLPEPGIVTQNSYLCIR